MTARPPFVSPYSVQYPSASSDLFPVESNKRPSEFEMVIKMFPRKRDCRFSAASELRSVDGGGMWSCSISVVYAPVIECFADFMPSLRTSSTESSILDCDEYGEGII